MLPIFLAELLVFGSLVCGLGPGGCCPFSVGSFFLLFYLAVFFEVHARADAPICQSLSCFDYQSFCVQRKGNAARFSGRIVSSSVLSVFDWGSSKGRCCLFSSENCELFWLSKFCVQRRGNAAHFSGSIFNVWFSKVWAQTRGKCCPFYWEIFFGLFYLSVLLRFKQGQMVPFFSESLSCFNYQCCCVQRRGKCCPFFWETFFFLRFSTLWVQIRGIFCSFCLGEISSFLISLLFEVQARVKFLSCFDCQNLGVQNKGNAAHFSGRIFTLPNFPKCRLDQGETLSCSISRYLMTFK